MLDSVKWLKSNQGPREVVIQFWRNSFEKRHKLLKSGHEKISTYVSGFPALRLQLGKELVSMKNITDLTIHVEK